MGYGFAAYFSTLSPLTAQGGQCFDVNHTVRTAIEVYQYVKSKGLVYYDKYCGLLSLS